MEWSSRLFKQAVNEAAGEKNTGGVAVLTRPTPSCQNSSFPDWGTLRIFETRTKLGSLSQRLQRLLKISSSKAAGSGATEAYRCGTSQGGTRLRTTLEEIFSSRLEVADGALKDRNLRHRIPGRFEFCANLLFEVGGIPYAVD